MSLLKNAGFNFIGAAVPAVVGLATIPYIIHRLGADSYGLLTLITSIVGYFALLDVNVTAGSTKYVSQFHASEEAGKVNQTISFGLLVYTVIGVVGMALIFLLSGVLVNAIFAVPEALRTESVIAVRWAALGFLIGQLQAYVQSLPGALMRYDISGRAEALFGVLVPVATVGLLFVGYGLVELVILRVTMSALQTLVIAIILRRLLPAIRWEYPEKEIRGALISFSAYSFLSRVAALTYTHVDKMIIGNRLGVAAVTYYSVPATLSNRVMALIFRLAGVMFPHASALASRGELSQLRSDYLLATRLLFFVNGAVAILLIVLARPILGVWLNPEFAVAGAIVLAFIAGAQWLDSMTNLPSMLNDAFGHPKVSGYFALARAFVGLAFITVGVTSFGIDGAAGGHFLASMLMTILFVIFVHGRTVPVKLIDVIKESYLPTLIILPIVGVFGWVCPSLSDSNYVDLLARLFFMSSVLLGCGWFFVIPASTRMEVSKRVCRLARTGGGK